MCGIAGGISLTPNGRPDLERVQAMSSRLAHRGPDGDGLWVSPSGRACLAHRRLSIIDLDTGQQPISNDAGTFALVFNGEIYNYIELRQHAFQPEEAFRTKSDTEVLLRLLVRDGAQCLSTLRGMFAFAAWDDTQAALLLARDPIGKKPLFYVIENGSFYFASSLAALRDTSPLRWTIDPNALALYLALGYIPAPLTIYRGVHKLPAATFARLDGKELRLERFWDVAAYQDQFEGSYEQALDRLNDLLDNAVRIRLRSDVPLGVFLSGGIDSSLVTAVANHHSSAGNVSTFSIGFDDNRFDESEYAAAVATQLGTNHHLFRVRTELFDLIPNLVQHYGEPFADSSALPTWVLAQHTRGHVTVALGGDGGDEGFAGYEWYATAVKVEALARCIPAGLVRAGSRLLPTTRGSNVFARYLGKISRGLDVLARDGAGERFAALRCLIVAGEADRLYAGGLLDGRGLAGGRALELLGAEYEKPGGSTLRRMRYVDISTYLADDLMTKVDVASMAHGLEVRAPLLDQDVLQFALSLPDSHLQDDRGGKRILRDLLARYLPPALFNRRKQGFSVPLQGWFANELRPRIQALPRSDYLNSIGMLNSEAIRRMVFEHIAGIRDHSQRLYSLLILEEWLKQHYSDASPATEYPERLLSVGA